MRREVEGILIDMLSEDEDEKSVVDYHERIVMLFRKAFDDFKSTIGIIWVWEANYYYAIRKDSLMAVVKLAKSNDSLTDTELYFQRFRCHRLYKLTDKLKNFIDFLEKFD